MKPVAYIFIALMLFLMVQPLLIACGASTKQTTCRIACESGSSCRKKEKNKKEENKDCDRTTGCNPFASCSQCQYVAASKFSYAGAIVQTRTNNIPSSNEGIASGYITDSFHPPELVSA